MPIAHIVFDLPIEGHFDYGIPEALISQAQVGMRARVSLGPRLLTGFIMDLALTTTVKNIKPLKRLVDSQPVVDCCDIALAKEFASYYGVSVGQALMSLFRDRTCLPAHGMALPTTRDLGEPSWTLHEVPGGVTNEVIASLVAPMAPVLLLVPDIFYIKRFMPLAQQFPHVEITTRSGLHLARGKSMVIMVDDENPSYQQERTPKYHARELLGMMAKHYGCAVHVVSMNPSVEIRSRVGEKNFSYILHPAPKRPAVMVVDVNIYNHKGLLTPAALAAMDSAVKDGQRALVVLNRRGNYAVTRCVNCSNALQCPHCASYLVYERANDQMTCRFCTMVLKAHQLACPQCGQKKFKSVGVGIAQLVNHMKKLFPQASVGTYQHHPKPQPAPRQQVVVATSAIMSLQGQEHFHTAVVLDMDRELNRLDVGSSLYAWSLVQQLRSMAQQVIVQTRQPQQDLLRALALDDRESFYRQEMHIRRELGFPPFKHWLKVMVRSPEDALAREASQVLFKEIASGLPQEISLHPVMPDSIYKKRDQFRYVIQLQGLDVPAMIDIVKRAQGPKRFPKVIVTLQVDP